MDIKDILKELMSRAGDNAYSLADRSGVPQPTIQRILSGKHGDPRSTTVKRLAAAYGVSESQLRGETAREDVPFPETFSVQPIAAQSRVRYTAGGAIDIPVMNVQGSMGPGLDRAEHDVVVGALRVSAEWIRSSVKPSRVENLSFIHGIGDSMVPTFSDGDILLVDTGIRDAKVDGVYVLHANDRIYIKRVRQRLDGMFEISSDNPSVKTVDLLNGQSSVDVLGRVIWAWNGRKL